jgi:hypothetical protein
MLCLSAVIWATWKIRNKICSEKIEIIFSSIAFMHYWAGMHSEDTQKMISMGVNLMVSTTMNLMRRRGDTAVPLTIWEVESEDDDEEASEDKGRTMINAVCGEPVGSFGQWFWGDLV